MVNGSHAASSCPHCNGRLQGWRKLTSLRPLRCPHCEGEVLVPGWTLVSVVPIIAALFARTILGLREEISFSLFWSAAIAYLVVAWVAIVFLASWRVRRERRDENG